MEAVLKVLASGATFELSREQLYIGRDPGNDVMVQDIGVSGYHARVLRTERGYLLIEERTSTGIWFEGRKVTSLFLEDGTCFRLGGTGFAFELRTGSARWPAGAPGGDPDGFERPPTTEVAAAAPRDLAATRSRDRLAESANPRAAAPGGSLAADTVKAPMEPMPNAAGPGPGSEMDAPGGVDAPPSSSGPIPYQGAGPSASRDSDAHLHAGSATPAWARKGLEQFRSGDADPVEGICGKVCPGCDCSLLGVERFCAVCGARTRRGGRGRVLLLKMTALALVLAAGVYGAYLLTGGDLSRAGLEVAIARVTGAPVP